MLLAVAAPLLLAAAAAVRLESRGPVFERIPGVSPEGRAVHLLAFRTRVDGAHTASHAAIRAAAGGLGTPETVSGRWLRRLRLVRLPRLLNVIAGHAVLR